MRKALPALAVLAAAMAAAAVAFVAPTYGAAATTVTAGGQPIGSTGVATRHSCASPLRPGAPVCFALIRTDVPAVRADALTPNAASASASARHWPGSKPRSRPTCCSTSSATPRR